MKQLICLATHGWCDTPSRTQQLLGRMRDTKILYFSPPGRDIRPSGQRVRSNITVYTLPTRLFAGDSAHPTLYALDQSRIGKFISNIAAKHNFHRPLLWTTSPQQVGLLRHIDHRFLVYDCYQEWDNLPIQWEAELAHLSDVIFVASPGLRDRLSPCNQNIVPIPNGVNFPLFSANPPPPPSARPVFGWVGRITPDLNLSPLLHAARSRPSWRFVLVGEQEGSHPLLPHLGRLPNVKILPPCSLADVPQYLSVCHVLLDFHRTGSAGNDIVPRRIYEYLSTGSPIVSLILHDQVELFPDVIYCAHTDGEFLHMCNSALNECPDFVRERRVGYGEAASWSARVAEISQILDTTGFL